MSRWAMGLISCIGALPAAAEEAPLEPGMLDVVVFGEALPTTEDEPVGTFFDARGRPCLVDRSGLECLDPRGEQAWGLDLAGVRGVRVAADEVVLDTASGWMRLVEGELSPGAGEPVLDAEGRVGWLDGDQLVLPGGDRVDLEGLDATEVILHRDGQIGVIDEDGGLVVIDEEGETSDRADLDLGRGGWLQVEALPRGGFAALDDDGLVLADVDGTIRAEVDVDADDLQVVDDGVWVSGPEGLMEVGPQGQVEWLHRGPVTGAAVDDDVLAILESSGRLRLGGGAGARAAVVALSPLSDGGVISVHEDGEAVRWSAAGAPSRLAGNADDAAVDGLGATWIATGDTLLRMDPAGTSRVFELGAKHLLPVDDGVVVGDGQTLRRIGARGETRWEHALAHTRRPERSGEVLLVVDELGVSVVDPDSGTRRRRVLRNADGGAPRGAGVAVGGLVVVAPTADGSSITGFRPGRSARLGYRADARALLSVSPNGRWLAWADEELVLRNVEGWPVLGRSRRPDGPSTSTAIATTREWVWVGRDDGRVERWEVGSSVEDSEVPAFSAYAQLDAFTAARDWEAEPERLGAGAETLVALPNGSVVTGPTPAWLRGGGRSIVPPMDPPRTASAGVWSDREGVVIGTPDGELLALSQTGEARVVGDVVGRIHDLCEAPDGWIVATDTAVRRVGEARSELLYLGETEDGRPPRVACGEDGSVHVDLGSVVRSTYAGTSLARVHPGGSRAVLSLPDGSLATGGNDELVVLWDPRRAQPMYVLEGHEAPVTHLAVDATGRRLVAGTDGRGAIVWDLLTLEPLGRFAGDAVIADVAWNADGTALSVAVSGGPVLRWRLPELPEGPTP